MVTVSEECTREAVVSPSLHVERAQVQSQMLHKLKQPLPQSVHHHVILRIQFSRSTDQTP